MSDQAKGIVGTLATCFATLSVDELNAYLETMAWGATLIYWGYCFVRWARGKGQDPGKPPTKTT